MELQLVWKKALCQSEFQILFYSEKLNMKVSEMQWLVMFMFSNQQW